MNRLWTRPKLTLRRRDHWQITGHPANTCHVVCDHVCGQPLGTPPPPTPHRQEATDAIPF